jgi:quercetin dioxygenase-like cupin family protein
MPVSAVTRPEGEQRMSVITANDTAVLDVVGDRMRVIADGSETDGAFEAFDVEGDQGSGPPPHAHPWAESFYVLEGALMIVVGDEQTLAERGTSVLVPAGVVHTFQVASPRARFITVTSGGQAAPFFRDLASNAPGVPTDETMPVVIEVARRHGLTSPLFD